MGERLRLIQGLVDGTLSGKDLERAKSNRIVVKAADAMKKERKIVEQTPTKKRVKRHGR